MTDLSIIIVTYNSAPHIGGLLTSIKKSNDKLSKEVIIIDNASGDNTVKIIRSHSLKTKLVVSPSNLGFAKAVNQGLKQSSGQYIFLLNPDSKLLPQTISLLHQFTQDNPNIAGVCPRLLNPDKKPQPSVFMFPSITNALLYTIFGIKNRYEKYLPKETTTIDIGVMAAMYLPRSTFDSVGMLDERFFLYYEDIEFCRRLKKARLPLYYFPAAKVIHVHGASGNFRSTNKSPALKSAKIYHGSTYYFFLNLVFQFNRALNKLRSFLPKR